MPVYTLQRFESNWNSLLSHLFLLTKDMQGAASTCDPASLLGLAAVLRSRLLFFAWTILFVCAHAGDLHPAARRLRSLHSVRRMDLFYAATLACTRCRIWLLRAMAAGPPATGRASSSYLVGWRCGKGESARSAHRTRSKPGSTTSPRAIRRLVRDRWPAGIRPCPKVPRMLFLDDGFQTDEWTPVFVLRLLLSRCDAAGGPGQNDGPESPPNW